MAADEDKVLFGSINALLADELHKCIDAGLVEGVASLPLMTVENSNVSDESESTLMVQEEDRRDQKMLNLLRTSYTRYVDLFEMYGERNIFTVAHRTPHFRKRIVEEFQKDNVNDNGNVEEEDQQSSADDVTGSQQQRQPNTNDPEIHPSTTMCMPKSADDIPSLDDIALLEEQIMELRNKVKQAQQTRANEERCCKELEEIAQLAQESNKVLATAELETMPATVDALLDGKRRLQQSKQLASKLIQTMDDLKSKRTIQEGENDPDALPNSGVSIGNNTSNPCKRPKTLEEHYNEDRKVVGDASVQDLREITQLLRQRREKA
jgi:hypothetical protein